jgi:predicted PurR-regulated permease PerM
MNNSTLLVVVTLAVVMLSAGLAVVPTIIQQVHRIRNSNSNKIRRTHVVALLNVLMKA